MFKKVLASILAAAMLMTAPVFAATTTDAVNGKTICTDDFEGKSLTNAAYQKDEEISDALFRFTSATYVNYSMGSIVEDVGRNGNTSKVFKSTQSSGNFALTLKPFAGNDETKVLQVSYDIKLNGLFDAYLMPRSYTGPKNTLFTFDASGNVKKDGGTDIGKYQANTWYHVVCYITYNGTNSLVKGWLIDPQGKAIYSESKLTAQDKQYMSVVVLNNCTSANNAYIDNVTYTTLDPSANKPYITDLSFENGGIVTADIDKLTVQFDQAVSTKNSVVKITPAGGEAAEETLTLVQNLPYTYTFELPQLEIGTEYTVDFSGVVNGKSLAVGEVGKYTFTTPDSIALDSTIPAANAENVAASIKEITVNFTREATVFPQTATITGGGETISANVRKVSATEFKIDFSERTADLKGLTTYTAVISGFKDSADNAVNKTISFTTENTDIKTFADSFEKADLITNSDTAYNNGDDKSGSVLTMAQANPGTDVTEVSLADGYTAGTKALQLKTGTDTSRTYLNRLYTTNKYTFTDDNKYIVTYRFRLDDAADYDTENGKYGCDIWLGTITSGKTSGLDYSKFPMTIQTNSDGKPVVCSQNNVNSGTEISEDKWYNIVWVMGKEYETKYLIDAETGKVVYSINDNFAKATRADKDTWTNYIVPVYAYINNRATTTVEDYRNVNQSFTIDDFKIWELKPERQVQKLSFAGENEGQKISPDSKIELSFNQPIMADWRNLTLYEIDGNTRKNAYTTISVEFSDFCKQKMSFTNLKYGHKYELVCDELTGLSSAAAEENLKIEFETCENPKELSVYDGVNCTGLTENDTVNFELSSKISGDIKVTVAFYDRSSSQSLLGIKVADKTINTGKNTVSVEVPKNVQNADFIKVYAFDRLDNLVPLLDECEIVAPRKSLKVLLIGTSMTEDTGRFLYDVAKAGGLDLDLTVKGVGGSSLDMHARNIREELAGRGGKETLDENNAAIMAGEESPRRAYFTYKNGVLIKASEDNVLLTKTLKEEKFDIISINQKSSTGSNFGLDNFSYIFSEIRKLQPDAQLAIHQTWYGWRSNAPDRRVTYTDLIEPYIKERSVNLPKEVSGITYNGMPIRTIPAGRAFYNTDLKYDIFTVKYPEGDSSSPADALTDSEEFKVATGLWRDSAHGSYYGCYLASACWYEFMTGKIAPIVDENGVAAVKKPEGIDDEEHIRRLGLLRDVAHETMLCYK